MCTAVQFCASGRYFGRNLDLECFGGEAVTLLPRRAAISFRCAGRLTHHAALIGTARVVDGRALFYEAMNEHGLAMAALRFPGAHYVPEGGGGRDVASFELMEYLLCRCAALSEARRALVGLRLTDAAFSEAFAPTSLHWMLSDGRRSLVIEAAEDGLQVWENPAGVLTNAPELPWHLQNLARYPLHPEEKAFGLPGDYSSASRFVRAAWVREHSFCEEAAEVSQVFRILDAAAVPRGSVKTQTGEAFFTRYTCCCDLQRRIYHVKTHDDLCVRSFGMTGLDGTEAVPVQKL